QDLAQCIVDLVGACMHQVFTLEINLGTTQVFTKAVSVIQRTLAAHIIPGQGRQFLGKGGVLAGVRVFLLQVEDQRHQRLGNEAAAKVTKEAALVGAMAKGLGDGSLAHALLPEGKFVLSIPYLRKRPRKIDIMERMCEKNSQ